MTKAHRLHRRLLLRDGEDRCAYCSVELTDRNRSVDHLLPRCQGGTADLDNLVLACQSCNTLKAGRTVEQWVRSGASDAVTRRVRRTRGPKPQPRNKGWGADQFPAWHSTPSDLDF